MNVNENDCKHKLIKHIKFLLLYNIMGKYKLVNPVIVGTFPVNYTASVPEEAAKQFWDNLTSDNNYVTGNVPKFLFTLQDEKSNKLHHYLVKETIEGKHADYSIKEINTNVSESNLKKFLNKSNKVRQNVEGYFSGSKRGGSKSHKKRYEDDDSSSDSDDEDDLFKYIRLNRSIKPIVYWWFTPSIYNTKTVFTPSFVAPISPYTQLWIPINN